MADSFTPGPWRIAGKATIRHDGGWIADVHWKNRGANARLIAAAPDLLAALQWAESLYERPGEGASGRFDRIAEAFRRDTGYLRPGKDASPMSGQTTEARDAAWNKWLEDGISRVRAAINTATNGAGK